MKNVTFVPQTTVGEMELRAFVIENGGAWNVRHNLQRGTFQESNGSVYVELYSDFLVEFEEPEKVRIEQSLGHAAMTAISLHVGHNLESEQLLPKIVNRMHERWGGLLLDCGNSFAGSFGSLTVLR